MSGLIGKSETVRVPGIKLWPLRVRHVSSDRLASLPADPYAAMRALGVRATVDGPATTATFCRWLRGRPALVAKVLAAALAVQRTTERERLMLRVLAFHGPGDGVWGLVPGDEGTQALGFDINSPMARPYATRWDVNGPAVNYADDYVQSESGVPGVQATIHPSMFTAVEPRLRVVTMYHGLARPSTNTITRDEYLTMSAFEVDAHRVLRDAIARKP